MSEPGVISLNKVRSPNLIATILKVKRSLESEKIFPGRSSSKLQT
ncbi:MAG: hypothetical protein V7K57_03830 [Nostoc sp.]